MKLKALDHVNIIASDMAASAAFYKDLLGLDIRPAPAPLPADQALWLYDDAGRAVVHLNHEDMPKALERSLMASDTGRLHHVAFECEGFADMQETLKAKSIDHHVNRLEAISLTQLFVEDPNGVLLELNFRSK